MNAGFAVEVAPPGILLPGSSDFKHLHSGSSGAMEERGQHARGPHPHSSCVSLHGSSAPRNHKVRTAE